MPANKVYIVMGVSGSGKTTIGRLLAERLGWAFHDGDNYHSEHNKQKMARGEPLDDADREPWLRELNRLLHEWSRDGNVVMACSALKRQYRETLRDGLADVEFVYLRGERSLISERLARRKGHYMPVALLDSQYAALEEPRRAIVVHVGEEPDAIVDDIIRQIEPAAGG